MVARFQEISGRTFKIEHVPESALRSHFEEATDPLQKSFAGLMLGYVHGDVILMPPVLNRFGIKLSIVTQYAKRVQGKAASA